jgi:HD superfamily phosphohydrolase
MKTFRDAVHGDIQIFPHELIVINTRTYQRLHRIRQLDLAHKIYQDAVHTRFEHSIGAALLADRIWERLSSRAQMATWAEQFSPSYKEDLDELKARPQAAGFRVIKLPEKDAATEVTRQVVRLATLLHDITHVPFGHLLENQLALFRAHDDGHRLPWFLSSIVLEVFTRFTRNRQEADPYYAPQNVYYLLYLLPYAATVLAELSRFADEQGKGTIGSTVDENKDDQGSSSSALSKAGSQPDLPDLPLNLPSEFRQTIDRLTTVPRLRPSQLFFCDIIGNTICADLLDYVRRDNYFTGLWDRYDDRIFRAFTLARVGPKVVQGGQPQIRLSIQVIKGRLRNDTISNVLRILELRYDLAEKVIFHHARCAASAMLARALCLSGLGPADEKLFYELGDDEAITHIEGWARERKEQKDHVDPEAVSRILAALRGRDFYKPFYRFLRRANEATRGGNVAELTVGETLFKHYRAEAMPFLQEIEERAGIDHGSIALYCPDLNKMMLKETRSIVSGDSEREIPPGEFLTDFVRKRIPVRLDQIEALEERYKELWTATFFVHPEFRGGSRLLKEMTMKLMEKRFGIAPTPDPILDDELVKLPTNREMQERIETLREVEIGVFGSVVASPMAARNERAVVEDTQTRISAEVNRQKASTVAKDRLPVAPRGSAQLSDVTVPDRAPRSRQENEQSAVQRPEQLPLGGQGAGSDGSSNE